MQRYGSLTVRQIHALAPLGAPPELTPDPLWFWVPHRVRAVAYRIGGTVTEFRAANAAYRRGLVILSGNGFPGGPWFPEMQASWAAYLGRYRFRWDPLGPLAWPEIYAAVETYYRRSPWEDIWKASGVRSGSVALEPSVGTAVMPSGDPGSERFEPTVIPPQVDSQ